ncbi:DUF2878 domain-containing protein [Psychromonas sp. psych-6C06]|uniref:DUF2878 domain-containing protein n=1 Tax=Psychromonas sp. psych-6C06 TaxID=2058089 RepID=UPI000C32BF80|nr:DUF2878 domain-containing protein [Psychromonas sp. psych-6C06]PKF63347.1 DUF2878 domain-containing protein [Psychromonas sp. psych-6C06]
MNVTINNKHFIWINFIWFQAIWFAAVLYTDQALPILVMSLCAHFLLSPSKKADLFTLLAITLVGSLADYLLTFLGIFIFPKESFIPLWLVLLWAHFSLTLNHSMRWLTQVPVYIQITFGAIFGTLSYYAGAKLGAVTLNENLLLSLFSISMIWASLLPVYVSIGSQNRIRYDEKTTVKELQT